MNDIFEEIYAVFLRDWRKKDKFIFDFLVSMIFSLIIYGLTYVLSKAYSYDLPNFLTPIEYSSYGVLVGFLFMGCFYAGKEIITDSFGLLKTLLVAPISKYSILFGETLSILVSSIKYYLVIGPIFLFVFNKLSLLRIILFALFIIYLTLISVACGLFFSTITKNKRINEYFSAFFLIIILFASGVFTNEIKGYFGKIVMFNPFSYIVDTLRYTMTGFSTFSIYLDFIVLIAFGAIICVMGIYMFERNVRK